MTADEIRELLSLYGVPEGDVKRICDAVAVCDSKDDTFEEWWKRYPLKVGKVAAKKRYAAKVKSREATPQQLLDGLERYILNKPSEISWSHPETWLNKGRWADEYEPQRDASRTNPRLAAAARGLGYGGWPTGPEPRALAYDPRPTTGGDGPDSRRVGLFD